jgi:expansin (peptidoglycan-binding protein)
VAAGTVAAAARQHQGTATASATLSANSSNTDALSATVRASGVPRSVAHSGRQAAASKPTDTRAKKKAQPRAEKAAAHRKTKPATAAKTATAGAAVGRTHTGSATFYSATGAGNCSFAPTGNLMVGAMNQQDYQNAQACGSFLAVTGPNGNTITIEIVDRCPECAPGAIDLSAQAFAKLAAPSAGKIAIHWRLLSPHLSGPITYTYKSGSSRYWCAIQVRNHRNPLRSLAVKVNGTWKSLPREDYNYFVSAGGAGCGGPLRVTDIDGHQLTDAGIAVRANATQRGHSQFPAA